MVFTHSEQHQICFHPYNNLKNFILLVLNWQYTVLSIENVMSIFKVIEIGCYCAGSVVMDHDASTMFLESFYSTHVNSISKMTVIKLTFSIVFSTLRFAWCCCIIPSAFGNRSWLFHLETKPIKIISVNNSNKDYLKDGSTIRSLWLYKHQFFLNIYALLKLSPIFI